MSDDIIETVIDALCDGASRLDATHHGRPDAFAQIAGRKTGRIANNEGIFDAHHIDIATQIIAVTTRVVLDIPREPTLG